MLAALGFSYFRMIQKTQNCCCLQFTACPVILFNVLSFSWRLRVCPTFHFSIRPNIFLGVAEGSAQYKKWYFELIIDQVEPFLTAEPTHLRVGWASSSGYAPYPGGGEGWGGNGVGDDLYSYGFDGLHLWSGEYQSSCQSFGPLSLTEDD